MRMESDDDLQGWVCGKAEEFYLNHLRSASYAGRGDINNEKIYWKAAKRNLRELERDGNRRHLIVNFDIFDISCRFRI